MLLKSSALRDLIMRFLNTKIPISSAQKVAPLWCFQSFIFIRVLILGVVSVLKLEAAVGMSENRGYLGSWRFENSTGQGIQRFTNAMSLKVFGDKLESTCDLNYPSQYKTFLCSWSNLCFYCEIPNFRSGISNSVPASAIIVDSIGEADIPNAYRLAHLAIGGIKKDAVEDVFASTIGDPEYGQKLSRWIVQDQEGAQVYFGFLPGAGRDDQGRDFRLVGPYTNGFLRVKITVKQLDRDVIDASIVQYTTRVNPTNDTDVEFRSEWSISLNQVESNINLTPSFETFANGYTVSCQDRRRRHGSEPLLMVFNPSSGIPIETSSVYQEALITRKIRSRKGLTGIFNGIAIFVVTLGVSIFSVRYNRKVV
jgi:hypothetical protein